MLSRSDKQLVGSITVTTNVRTGQANKKIERVIYKAVPEDKVDEINKTTTYRDLMLEVGSMAKDDGADKLYATTPEDIKLTEMRKVLECVTLTIDINFCVLTQITVKHREADKGGTQDLNRARREPRREEGMVVVKAGGRSYADLNREVKSCTEEEFEVRRVVKS